MKEKLEQLRAFLHPLAGEGVALAFSGGVDSSLLLALLSEMRKEKPFPLLLLTAVSTLQAPCVRQCSLQNFERQYWVLSHAVINM